MSKPSSSPLRQRMIEDMTIRRFKPRTQDYYVSAVAKFAQHFRTSPDQLDYEHVRQYQLHLVQNGCSGGSVRQTITVLRFFYRVTLGRADAPLLIPVLREPPKLRVILTREEVARFIAAAPGRKYRCAFAVAYGAGLRVSEIIALKVSDIDSARMVLRIEDGKGGRDRLAKLSPLMLEELRTWWKVAKPRVFLFPSRMKAFDHISARQFSRACRDAALLAKLDRSVHPHMLRHAFATHLLDQGVDVRVIQVMLGHVKLETTAIYAKVSPKLIQDAVSPFDLLPSPSARKPRKAKLDAAPPTSKKAQKRPPPPRPSA